MSESAIIRPEILAAKMAAVGNFNAPKVSEQLKTHPRLFELLWFIQAMSMRPGGLDKFCRDFLAEFPSRLGTPTMHTALKSKSPYREKERLAVMDEIPRRCWEHSSEKTEWLDNKFWNEAEPGGIHAAFSGQSDEQKRRGLAFVAKLNWQYFIDLCRNYAAIHLAAHLARACNEAESALENVWYFHDLPGALIEMLDLHAKREAAALAMTEVSLKIFDGMEYAHSEKALVSIFGDSRFGKTQSVKTWCAMWPGKARLVTVPCSNSDTDLFLQFARALGIEFSLNTSRREIKSKVEYVINFSGLGYVLDEFHFAFPARFSTNTPPMRLNWIRTEIVDRHCPVVMVSTPQEFERCKAKFVKATSHRIEQFLGRTMLTVILPNELEPDDLLAVAKKHFPDLDDDFLQMIVGTAMRAESYLMAVEAIAKRVRYIARRDGHKAVTLADLKLAISEILPAPAAPKAATAPVLPAPPQHPLAIKRPRNVRPALRPAAADPSAPARSITPATQLEPV